MFVHAVGQTRSGHFGTNIKIFRSIRILRGEKKYSLWKVRFRSGLRYTTLGHSRATSVPCSKRAPILSVVIAILMAAEVTSAARKSKKS
jgi:hypothetical protein